MRQTQMIPHLVSRRDFLAQGAVAPVLAKVASAPPPPEPPLLAKVRLGAEFFLNRTETQASIDEHFRRMSETGLTIVRIFTIWNQVEREQERWDFTGYDRIYDAAARNGILIANTLCSEDPPGWMGIAPFYHQWFDLANPKLQPYSRGYIEKVVTRYRGHAAHGVWLLQNEPGFRGTSESYLLPHFAKWLEKKYGSVDALNRSWYRPLVRFEDAPFPIDARSAGWADYPSLLDWKNFVCDHLADQQRWIHAEVDRHHPGALTHINPPGLTSNMPGGGRDLWKLKPTAHFLGASMHASWHFGMFSREEFGVAYGYCCDLVRSASAPKPYWVTELQAGPTILTGSRPLNPTGDEITRWLWDGIGNGARGIVFWLWHPRTEGNEAGEWGLAGPTGEPTPRTLATQAVARIVRQYDDFFSMAKPQAASAAILYSPETLILHNLETWRKPAEDALHSIMGCYKALHRAHVPVDFLYSAELEAGLAERYKVLYLPFCYALTEKSTHMLRRFVERGGTLWADGLVAWKNAEGATSRLPPGPLSDVFGFTLEDIDAQWGPFPFTNQADKAGELWRCVIPKGNATPLLQTRDGKPAAVENRFGKGRAIYYGTALSAAVLRRQLPAAERWIAGPCTSGVNGAGVRLLQGPGSVSFRVLETPDRVAALLNNWGAVGRVQILFPAKAKSAVDLVTSRKTQLLSQAAGKVANVELPGGASMVLLARLD